MVQYQSPVSKNQIPIEEVQKYQDTQHSRLQKKLTVDSAIEDSKQILVRDIKRREKQVTEVQNSFPLEMGRVLISSGDIVNSNCAILDWAFIEISQPLKKSLGYGFPLINELPYDNHPQLEKKYHDAGLYAAPVADPPRVATHFGEMVKGNWYFKSGRTSSITAGMCNGTEVDLNHANFVRYTESGQRVMPGIGIIRELIILSYE